MSHELNSPEPNRDIQIWPLVVVSAKRCWTARDDLLRLGIVPLIAIFLVTLPAQDLIDGILQVSVNGPEAIAQAVADATPRLLLLGLCSTAATCIFAVNLLRLMTLGPGSVPGLGLNIGGRHLRFFLFMLAVGIGVTLAAMVLSLLLHGFGAAGIYSALTLGIILWLGVIVRLSPRWIGIAIDAPMPLSSAWRRTRGQGLKLVLALFLIEMPALVLEQIVGVIFQATRLIEVAPLSFGFLICAVELVRVALQLGIFLAAYPQFVRETV